ncbi:MAG: type IV secretory system conjugative DNA transfer family protein, partial [Eubacterium sp.]|nr:type IV secretory system conjugative DNA transfer family protein [Eubacterium sp.]
MCENENMMILGENKYYSLDCYNTHLNNNVLVVGASGSGKTRSIVIPNLLQASGSYVVSDPKGNLYKEYGDYLRARGYEVKKLDFTSPDSSIGYNFFHYIHSTMDIAKMAHMLACHKDNTIRDRFWDEASQLLIQSLIAYFMEGFTRSEQNFKNLMKLLEALDSRGDLSCNESTLDILMKKHFEKNKDSY